MKYTNGAAVVALMGLSSDVSEVALVEGFFGASCTSYSRLGSVPTR